MYQQYLTDAKNAITYLSSEELKDLLNSDTNLEKYVNEAVKVLKLEKNVLIQKNRDIAEENVSLEPEIFERETRISELSNRGRSLCSDIQEKLKSYESYEGDKTPDTALVLLQSAAAECEDSSDEIAVKFQEKEMSIDEYLEKFMIVRKLMHTRKIKAEKMLEIIQMHANNKMRADGKNSQVLINYTGSATGYIPFSQPKQQTFRHF